MTWILVVFGLALSAVIGALALAILWPGRAVPGWLLVVLSWPIGTAITSALYFVWLLVSGGTASLYVWLEVGLLVGLIIVANRLKRRLVWRWRFKGQELGLGLASVTICMLLRQVVLFLSRNPWGYWDAWARINTKGRFLFAGGKTWTWIFESDTIHHPDYPLLLPCSVARLWTWSGSIGHAQPQAISFLFALLCPAILFCGVVWLRSARMACVVVIAYAANISIDFWSAAQYADIPLAAFMVAALVLLTKANHATVKNQAGYYLLSGLFLGACAWCKNEGIAFAAVCLAIYGTAAVKQRRFKSLTYMGIGLFVVGVATVTLKLMFRSDTDLFAEQRTRPIWELAVDPQRHAMILRTCADYFVLNWSVLATVAVCALYICAAVRHGRATAKPLLTMVSLAVIYYCFFLTTPLDLQFHLGTALDRLLVQLWPPCLFSFAVLINSGARDNDGLE